MPFLSSVNWYRFLDNHSDIYTSDGNYGELQIDAKEAVIFTNEVQMLTVDKKVNPEKFHILQAYPNPFNSSIKIILSSDYIFEFTMNIYDISGKLVESSEYISSDGGNTYISWDGLDNQGLELPTGIYLVNIKSINFNHTKKYH